MKRRPFSVLAAAALAAFGVTFTLPACSHRTPRCQEWAAVKCPTGQYVGRTPDDTCEQLYEGACGGVWADYVDCYIADPTCVDETTNIAVHVSACDFEAYPRCECAYETQNGGSSPWCSL